MQVRPVRTRVFREGENLADFIVAHVPSVREGTVLVVTSKIVALSEGRTREIEDATTREKVIREESDFAMPTMYTWLTLKDGLLMSSAGVDESNADGKLILLPKDSFRAASSLRRALMKRYRVKRLGILIPDSRVLALRQGAVGVALGYAGFRGIRDYRGLPDIFGRKMTISRTNVPDSLASAAVLVMGEGDEQQPIAVIEDAPIEYAERVDRKEVSIPPEHDMYRPFFEEVRKRQRGKGPLPEWKRPRPRRRKA